MRYALFLSVFFVHSTSYALDVTLLTQQGTRVLRSWSASELSKLAQHRREISAQKLIIDESTENLDLKDRADVDLITFYGENNQMARIPRFMVWRGSIKLELDHGVLRSKGETSRLLVPAEIFKINGIQKIELSRASLVYPGTKLVLRTNPAASRGEKLYTQSCLACHSLSNAPKLPVSELTFEKLQSFNSKHSRFRLSLDPKSLRGLGAYREALASEKTEVK